MRNFHWFWLRSYSCTFMNFLNFTAKLTPELVRCYFLRLFKIYLGKGVVHNYESSKLVLLERHAFFQKIYLTHFTWNKTTYLSRPRLGWFWFELGEPVEGGGIQEFSQGCLPRLHFGDVYVYRFIFLYIFTYFKLNIYFIFNFSPVPEGRFRRSERGLVRERVHVQLAFMHFWLCFQNVTIITIQFLSNKWWLIVASKTFTVQCSNNIYSTIAMM